MKKLGKILSIFYVCHGNTTKGKYGIQHCLYHYLIYLVRSRVAGQFDGAILMHYA